jgi:hypothetical protein
MFKKIATVIVAIFAILPLVSTTAQASNGNLGVNSAARQQELLRNYGMSIQHLGVNSLVIDSNLTYEQALGDSVVPEANRDLHMRMKPYLRVVPVIYWGFESTPRVHVGQIVVHRDLVADTNKAFIKMFTLGFPIKSVIPESQFGYDDQRSMAADNSSNYRPEPGSEHRKGAAFDLNPFQNPFDITGYDPTHPIEPAGAHYDPTAKGTIVKEGPVRKYMTSLHYEWGGGWGDPNADPQTDFFAVGYFDYQHFQLDFTRYNNLPLPSGI